MRLKRPSLGLEARTKTFRLDLGRQLASLLRACAEAEPNDARQAPPVEGPKLAKLQVEAGQLQTAQPAGDAIHHRQLDCSDETHREMKVRGRRPTEPGRRRRAGRKVRLQPVAQRVREGQPEERADSGRYFRAGAFVQCVGTQVLGAVGRHP